jgi:hypothetical protein
VCVCVCVCVLVLHSEYALQYMREQHLCGLQSEQKIMVFRCPPQACWRLYYMREQHLCGLQSVAAVKKRGKVKARVTLLPRDNFSKSVPKYSPYIQSENRKTFENLVPTERIGAGGLDHHELLRVFRVYGLGFGVWGLGLGFRV